MVLMYATTDDLAAEPWGLSNPPTNAGRLIARASGMVLAATRSAVYTTGSDDLPTDTKVAEAFRDAVCAQVAMWAESGIDPTKVDTSPGIVSAKSMGPRSVSYAGAEQAAADRSRAASGLSQEALGYLRNLPIWPGIGVYG